MATKGASFRYGNTNGSNGKGKPTKHIRYAWAKDFNRGGLEQHFRDHGKEFGVGNPEEYASKAVHFANEVDRKNYKSVVDWKNTTYKYDTRSGVLCIVDKNGFVISYHHTGSYFKYTPKKGGKEAIVWIRKKNK